MHLYSSAIGAIGPFVDLTIDKGTGTTVFPNCAGFMPDASPNVFTGTLGGFAAAQLRLRDRLPGVPGRADRVEPERRRRVPIHADAAEQPAAAAGTTSGLHSFTWEAQNQ